MWTLWKARNDLHFKRSYPSDVQINIQFEKEKEDWSVLVGQAAQVVRPPSLHLPPITISPPSIQSLTIHCDGSFLHDSQKAAYGVIISNSVGVVLDGKAGIFYCNSPIVSEAKAILVATEFACARSNNDSVVILSDCQELISALNGPKHRWPWECFGYLGRVSALASLRPNLFFQFIPRKDNVKADWVARNARLGLLHGDWVGTL
ncbi:hypothetical protein LINPERPRIM_LOCUS17372 [Linum perenne]